MEFRDLKTQYIRNKEAIDSAIQGVLSDGQFIGGEPVKRLEEQLAEYVGVKHCITCANGTDALQLALMSWNIGKGDAVFVPDFTFFSTGEVVPWVNATPVFVDVEKDTFNISVKSLETAIKKVIEEGKLTPKVVIAVDLFGQPANYVEIKKITEKYDLLLLEDGAQGFGGAIGEQRACSFGDISTTSFFPAKPLGCYGDGGAIFTDNDEWAKMIRSLCVHGKGNNKYDNIRIGLNSRLDTLQAAILQIKLKIFKEYELKEVNQVAEWYHDSLKELGVVCPAVLNGFYSSWAQYTIILSDREIRDKIQKCLNEKGIPGMIYYIKPMHKQEAFANIDGSSKPQATCCSNTDYLCDRVLSLPMHPYMSKDDVMFVVEVIAKGLRDSL